VSKLFSLFLGTAPRTSDVDRSEQVQTFCRRV